MKPYETSHHILGLPISKWIGLSAILIVLATVVITGLMKRKRKN